MKHFTSRKEEFFFCIFLYHYFSNMHSNSHIQNGNGYENFENRSILRPGVRGDDGGLEYQFFGQNKIKSAVSLNHVKSPAQLWWNRVRQNVRNQNGNQYNFEIEDRRASSDKRPVRRYGGR